MLRNLEASAQTATSPPRLLLTHWPVGIVAGAGDALWASTSGSVGSPGLKPFGDAGLGADMTVFRGISTQALSSGGCAGSHEGGTPKVTTGLNLATGCRRSDTEGDDGVASGPSIDQILLTNVPALKSPMGGSGFANAICDSRVDTQEIGAQCLSYAYMQEPVVRDDGTSGMQAHPNMPTLSPLTLYNTLFMNFVPTGGGGGNTAANAALIKQLAMKKSVLDHALEEINQMGAMAPSIAKNRLDTHTGAIRDMESSIQASITNIGPAGGSGGGGGNPQCLMAPMAPPNVTGSSGNPGNQYTACAASGGRMCDGGTNDDGPVHQQVAGLHMDILRAAMVCDIIRVGSFQFSPGTNHVSLKGFYPGDPNGLYQHHPVSHRIVTSNTTTGTTAAALDTNSGFLFNVQVWYFGLHAANLAKWKTQLDAFGNSLLDYTVVPFVTEVRATGHEQTNMPAMIIGGKKLGFLHNKYMTGNWTVNQYFGTIAQAYGYASQGVVGAPIAGVWTKPA